MIKTDLSSSQIEILEKFGLIKESESSTDYEEALITSKLEFAPKDDYDRFKGYECYLHKGSYDIERNCVVNEVKEAIDKAYAFAGKTSLNEIELYF